MVEYIDKDKSLKELLDWCAIYGYGGLSTNDIKRIFRDNIQTADVRENVKGKWLHTGNDDYSHSGYFMCSECGATYVTGGNYCSNCGACMRGGDAK